MSGDPRHMADSEIREMLELLRQIRDLLRAMAPPGHGPLPLYRMPRSPE